LYKRIIIDMKKLILLLLIVLYLPVLIKAQVIEEEVTIENNAITLSGTLSYPKTSNKLPAIVLVSGSGPQNRDSEIVGFKPFKILADHLNEKGIAVLRYDDRGHGKSIGKTVGQSTSEELATGAEAAFNYLKNHKAIDNNKVGLLGHSEGGIIAPMVASIDDQVAFVVLMAGYGVKGIEVTAEQQKAILKAQGMTDAFIEKAAEINNKIISAMQDDSISEEEVYDLAKKLIIEQIDYLPDNVQAQITDKEAYANFQAQSVVKQMKSPWIQFYMTYDPKPTLEQLECPVLMLFGGLDTQITVAQNKAIMEEALANNKNVETKVFENANHLFQKAKTGSPMEYSTLEKEFVEGFEEYLSKWILEKGVN